MITRRGFITGMAAGTAAAMFAGKTAAGVAKRNPNVIFIISDDVGYGDLGCYGATQVKTPNLDRLAAEGIRLTDAHSTSSVCTPSRYAVLTGRYAWRCPEGDHILSGVAPLSIDPAMATTPSVLRTQGYATGLVGKWHLGLGTKDKPVDYNTDIAAGPLDVGFDYAYFYPATNDRVPCVYVENRRVVGLDPADPIRVSYEEKVGDDPTGADHPELLKMKSDTSHSKTIVNGISRIGYMAGGKTARWVDEDMADVLAGKAVEFIERNKERPFFLYFAPHDIHEPMAPNSRFRGTSGCGTRGDALHELDWTVGQVLAALDKHGLAGDTLIVFTSDNGGAIKDTYDDGTNAEHARQPPNGALRGYKGNLYEGGHRMPFLARWPGHIRPGSRSDALVGLVDMMATFTAAAGGTLSEDAGPDSFNALPALLGRHGGATERKSLVMHTNGNGPIGLRAGSWTLLPGDRNITRRPELYDLRKDLKQEHNLAATHPRRVEDMVKTLKAIQAGTHTRR